MNVVHCSPALMEPFMNIMEQNGFEVIPTEGPDRPRRRTSLQPTRQPVILRCGASLLNTLMSVTVGAIILGGAVLVYGHAQTSRQVEDLGQEILLVHSIVGNIYSGTASGYATLDARAVISSGHLPRQYHDDKTLYTPFHTVLNVGPLDGDAGYSISASGISRAICFRVALFGFGTDATTVSVNGQTIGSGGASPAPADATSACSQDTDNALSVSYGSVATKPVTTPASSPAEEAASDPIAALPENLQEPANDLAKLMKQQMEKGAQAAATYASASASAASYQASAQAAGAAGDYDTMNADYNAMNQALNQKNEALNEWNQAKDLGNRINSAEQGIYANTGQNASQTDAAIKAAAASVNYVDPTVNSPI